MAMLPPVDLLDDQAMSAARAARGRSFASGVTLAQAVKQGDPLQVFFPTLGMTLSCSLRSAMAYSTALGRRHMRLHP